MKTLSLNVILSTLLLIFGLTLTEAAGPPLSQHDLFALLAGGVYSSRIADLVEERGITFVPSPAFLSALRQAGAEPVLQHAVAVAPHIIHSALPASRRGFTHQTLPVPPPSTAPPLASGSAAGVASAPSAKAQSSSASAPKPLEGEPGITVGATINMGNWRQYTRYMPFGMVQLFAGKYYWKMPADLEIKIGPTVSASLPAGYLEATKRFSADVIVEHLKNGSYDLRNYKGGMPFPDPQEPDKGYKLLADLWYAYIPHLIAGTARNPLSICTEDQLRDISCSRYSYANRQLAYNTDPGVPETERNTLNSWYAEWLSVEEPEQTKYTTMLILIPQDNQESKSLFVFVPALRRSLRSSLGARCSPLLGTDYAEDDFKWQGYNGGIGGVQAKALGHQQILALVGDFAAMGGNLPDSYYMPLGWPKPSWGAWQLRDVDAINVMPIRSERRGYCYGKRIIYEDSATHYALWEDIFDTEMKLWKTAFLAQRTIVSKSLGEVPGPFVSSGWDLKYNHMTNTSTQNRYGEDLLVDSDAPREYQNLIAYTTPAGLAQIMR